jgi:hypothetical protein
MWVGGGLLIAAAGLAAIVAVLAHRAEPFLRARIVEELQERFHARVELDSFHLAVGVGLVGEWGVWAEGKGLRIWPPAQVVGVTVSRAGGAGNGWRWSGKAVGRGGGVSLSRAAALRAGQADSHLGGADEGAGCGLAAEIALWA